MSIIFKVNYRFNAILIKIPTTLLQIKSISKFKRSQKAKTILTIRMKLEVSHFLTSNLLQIHGNANNVELASDRHIDY